MNRFSPQGSRHADRQRARSRRLLVELLEDRRLLFGPDAALRIQETESTRWPPWGQIIGVFQGSRRFFCQPLALRPPLST